MRRLLVTIVVVLALAPAAEAKHTKFAAPLPIPQVLTASDIEIPMRETEVQILPGRKTRMWTYGGTFPGPTVRPPPGEPTRKTFVNDLAPEAGPVDGPRPRGRHPHDPDGETPTFPARPRA